MTTEQQTEPQATEPQGNVPAVEPDEDTLKLANEQVRNYANRLKDENKELRTLAMEAALGEIGLSPSEGLGVAIVESYEGAFTKEAIAEYAESKYKHTASNAPVPKEVETHNRLDELNAVGESVTPTPEPTEGEKAAQSVDGNDPEAGRDEAVTSLTAKVGQFTQEHYG